MSLVKNLPIVLSVKPTGEKSCIYFLDARFTKSFMQTLRKLQELHQVLPHLLL